MNVDNMQNWNFHDWMEATKEEFAYNEWVQKGRPEEQKDEIFREAKNRFHESMAISISSNVSSNIISSNIISNTMDISLNVSLTPILCLQEDKIENKPPIDWQQHGF